MYLVVDTETTNFPQSNIELSHPCQARIIQLGALLLDKDFKEAGSLNTLLKVPEGTQIHPGAFEKHGISVERARQYGLSHEYAFQLLDSFAAVCDVFVAFNIAFDLRLLNMESMILRDHPYSPNCLEGKKVCCAMESSTNLVKMPFANGSKRYGQKYKWPKLEEAYAFFMHKQLEGAHDALTDCRATSEVFRCLIENDQAVFM